MPRAPETPKGYAAPPGFGPAGETCRSCAHAVRSDGYRRGFWKCRANELNWSRSRRSDILLSSPACRIWEQRQEGVRG